MSAIRKIAVPAATLFLGLSALLTVTATATANAQPSSVTCDNDWHNPSP